MRALPLETPEVLLTRLNLLGEEGLEAVWARKRWKKDYTVASLILDGEYSSAAAFLHDIEEDFGITSYSNTIGSFYSQPRTSGLLIDEVSVLKTILDSSLFFEIVEKELPKRGGFGKWEGWFRSNPRNVELWKRIDADLYSNGWLSWDALLLHPEPYSAENLLRAQELVLGCLFGATPLFVDGPLCAGYFRQSCGFVIDRQENRLVRLVWNCEVPDKFFQTTMEIPAWLRTIGKADG